MDGARYINERMKDIDIQTNLAHKNSIEVNQENYFIINRLNVFKGNRLQLSLTLESPALSFLECVGATAHRIAEHCIKVSKGV